MKKFAVIVLVLMLSVVFIDMASAQVKTVKGPNAMAYEKASDESVINRVGDWFATRGKSDKEKQAILSERKVKRATAKLKKQADKKAKQAKVKMNKAGKGMGKGLKMPKK